ncbi:MAG: hypothetical protein QG608_3193, partial [Actinomycetota bacterium]|nr:hypothetical protein [Actinomycetota bacterium]
MGGDFLVRASGTEALDRDGGSPAGDGSRADVHFLGRGRAAEVVPLCV